MYRKIVYPLTWIIILITLLIFSGCTQTDTTSSVVELTQRILGESANDFHFIRKDFDSKSEQFSITSREGKVIIEGSSNVSLSYGLYTYLKRTGTAMVNWEGSRVELPKKLPSEVEINLSTVLKYRSYLNVCAFGYTTPWWNWDRWEEEIDWMALHGINMPTAMEGQEAVLYKLWIEFGLSDDEVNNHFTGPAFLPWQRMGNINSHMGPLPNSWIKKKTILQKKILKRMHSLGMKPIVPAFNGYVPKAFWEKFPHAKIHKMESWGDGIEETYWLDPIDPLFTKIAARFIEIYSNIYGEENFYLVDVFNEMKPPVLNENKLDELKKYGSLIYESIKNANPSGVWVMQGWLFGNDKGFWTPEAIQAFLSGIPNDKMIIQDFGNDRKEVWEDAKAFYGKEWIFGYVHNYGGTNPVFGDLEFYNKQFKSLINNEGKKNLVGYGIMPEGLNNNSVVYEYLYDLVWSANGIEPNDWLKEYTKARYGKSLVNSNQAWQLFNEAVYKTKYWKPRWWEGAGSYLFNKRPTLKITNFEGHPGNINKLEQGIKLFLKDSIALKNNEFYKYDLIEFSRHHLSIKLDSLLVECVNSYKLNDIKRGDQLFSLIEKFSSQLDSLISVQPINKLNYWLSSAWNYGETESESELYLRNAKMQITVWGGNHLKDYASKSWSKMYSEFYWPRWKMFLQALRESIIKNKPFNEILEREKINQWEIEWTKGNEMYPVDPLINPVKYISSQMDGN